MAYASAVSNKTAARAILSAIKSRRVAIEMVGDSNMLNVDGGSYYRNAIRQMIARGLTCWGGPCDNRLDGSFGDASIAPTGLQPSGYGANLTAFVDAAAPAAVIGTQMFTRAQHAAPPTGALGVLTGPEGWARVYNTLPAGQTSPAASGTITGQDHCAIEANNTILGNIIAENRAGIEYWFEYYIPAGAGPVYVGWRVTLTTTFLGGKELTARDARTVDSAVLPTNVSGNNRGFQLNHIAVNFSTGEAHFGPGRVVDSNRTSGFALSNMYMRGSYSGWHTLNDMVFSKAARANCLIDQLRWGQIGIPSGQETCVIWTKHLGNDSQLTNAAWVYAAGTATATGSAHNTRAGYSQSLDAFCHLWYDAWVSAGFNPANLFFVQGAYHPQPIGSYTANQAAMYDGARDLIGTASHLNNLVVIDGNQIITSDEMTANSWYGAGGSAHLSTAGSIEFERREVDAFISGASGGTSKWLTIHRLRNR